MGVDIRKYADVRFGISTMQSEEIPDDPSFGPSTRTQARRANYSNPIAQNTLTSDTNRGMGASMNVPKYWVVGF